MWNLWLDYHLPYRHFINKKLAFFIVIIYNQINTWYCIVNMIIIWTSWWESPILLHSNNKGAYQPAQNVGPDLDPKCLTVWWRPHKGFGELGRRAFYLQYQEFVVIRAFFFMEWGNHIPVLQPPMGAKDSFLKDFLDNIFKKKICSQQKRMQKHPGCNVLKLGRANSGTEFVVAKTLAEWKKLEPNEINFNSQVLACK